ncbi:hypothetical protein EDB19DRAFT_364496 [Suillus lakei]|nr:hypothetical protein EDB19DRAFT_364496 [Suillus lakei]
MLALDCVTANILIDEGGHARLIDFGLSTLVRPLLGRSYLAATSIHPGAIRYAAPELFLSDDVCDLPLEKTDLYSFGCVMFQILSGRYPWSEPGTPQWPSCNNGLGLGHHSKLSAIQPELRPSAAEVYDFVMHRVSPSDSSSPSDDPPDNVQDGFHGASQYDDSDDSDTTERPPNSPPPHPGHELTNVIIEPGSPGPVTVFGTDSRVVQSTGFSGLEQRQSIQPLPPSPPPSPPNVTSSNRESHLPSTVDSSKIRKKIGRFRILIIGRANAGKTTILQRVCNTRDNPEIYNSAREKIDPAVLTPSRERGLHDIENEMVFRHNPGFVFHDSRGFEAGGESEFNMVKAFIADRSKERDIKKRLHVIWYCIPMDEESRSFTQVEHKFFSQCDTGSVPVMVLFTKFDAFYDIEFTQLRRKGTPWKDAEQQAPKLAEVSFANGPYLKFLKDVRWPPKCHICLSNMHFVDADCRPLIERTAETLDNEVLMQMFISTQQINLEFCMKNAVEQTLAELVDSTETISDEGHEKAIGKLGAWFPHLSAR